MLWLDVGTTKGFSLWALCPSAGSLTESYDELGNRYQLPKYTLSPPVNLITESSSQSKGSESAQKACQSPVCRAEFQLRVRLSTGERAVRKNEDFVVDDYFIALIAFIYNCFSGKDVRLSASMADSIGQLKKQLKEQEDIDVSCQRWFFFGKLLTDQTRLQDTKIQKDFVVQVIVNINAETITK